MAAHCDGWLDCSDGSDEYMCCKYSSGRGVARVQGGARSGGAGRWGLGCIRSEMRVHGSTL